MRSIANQPSLFKQEVMHLLYVAQQRRRSVNRGHTSAYLRWWCSPVRDRQRFEALTRQHFRCDYCGYLLDSRRFDIHHTTYDYLGFEEASDLIAVHRRCHRVLEEAKRREVCGCGRAA